MPLVEPLDDLMLVEAVDATIQRNVRAAGGGEMRQCPLAEFIEKIELDEDRVVVEAARHLLFDVHRPYRAGDPPDRLLVEGRKQPEPALDPALQHRTLGAVAVEPPALDQIEIGRTEAAAAVAAADTLLGIDPEQRRHIAGERLTGFGKVACLPQHLEQAGVHLAHAGDMQRHRRVVEADASEKPHRHADEVAGMPDAAVFAHLGRFCRSHARQRRAPIVLTPHG